MASVESQFHESTFHETYVPTSSQLVETIRRSVSNNRMRLLRGWGFAHFCENCDRGAGGEHDQVSVYNLHSIEGAANCMRSKNLHAANSLRKELGMKTRKKSRDGCNSRPQHTRDVCSGTRCRFPRQKRPAKAPDRQAKKHGAGMRKRAKIPKFHLPKRKNISLYYRPLSFMN